MSVNGVLSRSVWPVQYSKVLPMWTWPNRQEMVFLCLSDESQ